MLSLTEGGCWGCTGADQQVVLEGRQELAAEAEAAGGEGQLVGPADAEADKEAELSAPKPAPGLATVKEEPHAPNSPLADGKAKCACCTVA